jgi:FtsP/CotA-like multicopper oxidase with cupredoxin domain
MRGLLLVLALGCRPPVALQDGPDRTQESSGELFDTSTARVELRNPDEAIDLNPAPGVLEVQLIAAPTTHVIGEVEVAGYAYNGQTPGPTLRATVGDTLIVELVNDLDVETTIHWHGVSVPWAMDGVTWQSAPVPIGDVFTYTFTLNRAGTFWYHPHFDTERQVDLGLYGVLIVEDPAEPVAEDERILVFDTWSEVHDHSQDLLTNHHSLSDLPTTWTVNGLVNPVYRGQGGDRVRVRAVNVSNTGYLDLDPSRQIAGDQGLLAAADETSRSLLGPGDRAEFEWAMDASGTLSSRGYSLAGGTAWGEPFDLLQIDVTSPASAAGLSWPFDGVLASEDPGATDITYVFTGDSGAGGWMINGEQFPDVTIETVALGAEVVIEVRNLSPSEHPFHLHGHPFEVLSTGGVPSFFRKIEDTVNVRIGEAVRLKLLADNPGDWMAHCHILPHAHLGMMTVLRVAP